MARGGVVFTKDNEYYTPKYVVDYFGQFDYDPATVKEKALEFGLQHFDTEETDGLKTDWTQFRRIWINPPFTRKHEFLKKAQETYDIAKNEIYILFPIEFLTTQRFHSLCRGGVHLYPRWADKLSKRFRQKGHLTSIWQRSYETTRYFRGGVYQL